MNASSAVLSLLGGLLIGLSSALLLYFHGRIAGVSGILSGIVSPHTSERDWRIAFVLGLVVAGGVMAQLMPNAFVAPMHANLALLISGGVVVGVGSRLGNGCTSGHGVCGIGRLSKRSIVATLTFMATGMITVALMRIFGGAA